jgi:hypothetical protein
VKSWLRATLLAVLVLAFSAVPANAGLLVSSVPAASCKSQVLEQPFTRWLDNFYYTLVPGGTFEKGMPAWTLSGASIVTGNETFYVRSTKDTRSLSLGATGTAQSKALCVSIYHPTLRFFVRNAGTVTALLAVDVMFEDAAGKVKTLQIATVTGGSAWQPTLPYAIVANLLAVFPNGRTAVAFRFRALGGGGKWQIDDVFVDPYRKS